MSETQTVSIDQLTIEERFSAAPARESREGRISSALIAGLIRGGDVAILLGMDILLSWLVTTRPGFPDPRFTLLAGLAGLAAVSATLACSGAYGIAALRNVGTQAVFLAFAILLGSFAHLAVLEILRVPAGEARSWVTAWALAACAGLGMSRWLASLLLRLWTEAGRLSRATAFICGCNDSLAMAETLSRQAGAGRSVVGIFGDGAGERGGSVAGNIEDLIKRCRRQAVDDIVICVTAAGADSVAEICGSLESVLANIYLCLDSPLPLGPARRRQPGRAAERDLIANRPVVKIGGPPLQAGDLAWKRAFDWCVSAALLVLLAPALGGIAIMIKLDSPGPVLFRQPRLGYNNVPFTVFKFRSMRNDMADLLANRQTSRGDPRVTRVGKWLRRLSLDELPQLFNVLRGEMSLVGPRPHAPNTQAGGRLLHEVVADYAVRHRVKPGITGWAQVNGSRGEIRTAEQIRERVRYDLEYIRNWNLLLDCKILVLTVLREVLSSRAF